MPDPTTGSVTLPPRYIRHIPNAISASRFPLALVFCWGIGHPEAWPRYAALAAVVLAIFSDWADGWSARKLGLGSDFGKLFDPAADAFFFVAAAVGLALAGIIPWWLAVPFVVREMVQHGWVRPTALRLGVAMGAKFIGKLKTSVQAGAMIMVAAIEIVRVHADLYVALIRTDVLFGWLDWAQWTGVGIAAALSVASIVPYVVHLRRLKSESRP